MRSSAIRLAFAVISCATLAAELAVAQVPQPVPSSDKERILTPGTYARFATSEGDFTVRLFEDRAPETVANFVGLAEGTKDPATGKPGQVSPFYDGLTFHRIIAGFMIQGGDPKGDGRGGPGYTFVDEFDATLRFDRPGLLAMANRGPNTNGSQFFITLAATEWLNNKHTIFGEIVEGMDVIRKVGTVKTGPGDRPVTPVVMKSVTIQRINE
jgi:peptidyl-prolyl cis-trans isomerase A (cyclophilin A)